MTASRFALILTAGITAWAQNPGPGTYLERSGGVGNVVKKFAESTLTMEPNRGQAAEGIDFLAIGVNHRFLFASTSMTLESFDSRSKSTEQSRLEFLGARTVPGEGLDMTGFHSSYFTRLDPEKRQVGLPNYARVRYRGIWPGIDVVYYGNRRNLEYDLVVAPGADPSAMKLRLTGASFSLNREGDLVANTRAGSFTLRKPAAYQTVGTERREVRATFALKGSNEVRFRLGRYDHSRELVIDPVLNLSQAELNQPFTSVAVDAGGDIYGGGQNNGGLVFVFKMNPNGVPLSLDQFIGSTMGTIAVTPAGVAYVTGMTQSAAFQTSASAYQTAKPDGQMGASKDAFFIKYVPGSNVLTYATFFGSASDELGFAAAVDSSGFGYITGQSYGNLPTTMGPSFGGVSDAFLAKFDPTKSGGASLLYSTYLGGNNTDAGTGIQVDSGGNIYVGGVTQSTSASFHPTSATGYNTVHNPTSLGGFILKLNNAGSTASYLTFLPKAPVAGIAVDTNQVAYVTGDVDGTANALATTASGYQLTQGGDGCTGLGGSAAQCTDAFLSKYDTTTGGVGSLLYSTYLGGNLVDSGFAVAVDANSNAYVAGQTNSTNFPIYQPLAGFQAYKGGVGLSQADAFLVKINTLAAGVPSLIYSTYFGGSAFDQGTGVAAVGCTAYMVGYTESADFPTTPAQTFTPPQGFVAKVLDSTSALSITKTHSTSFRQGQQATYTITVSNTGCGTNTGMVTVTDNLPSGLALGSLAGTGWSCASNSCNRSDSLNAGASYQPITATVNVGGSATSPQVNSVTVTGTTAPSITTTDSTIVLPANSGLGISVTHSGNFTQAQTNAMFSIVVSNPAGGASTVGTVTVTDNVSSGMTLASLSGTGWSCSGKTCTRSDTLAPGNSYPAITAKVNVAFNATTPQVNSATVSGGGSPDDNASDTVGILLNSPTLTVNRTVLNFGYNGSYITGAQTVTVGFAGGLGVPWVASSNRSNIMISNGSGTGPGTFTVTASNGPSGAITVSAPGAQGGIINIQINVTNVAIGTPFGSFDTPVNNTVGVVGAVAVTGWALDNIQISTVGIWREKAGNETGGGLVFIANAIFVADARPDVAGTYGDKPYHYRAGWGYQLLTNFLPVAAGPLGNGTYKLHVILTNVAGVSTDIGTHTITVDNAHATKPFGTLDTPGQGDTVSGTQYVNFGWALTPQPNCIPTDGSTMYLTIDSVVIAHPVYNNLRSDIQNAFPGYCNTNGAVGYVIVDTTTLTNGVHTIGWLVYDDHNNGEGLGSRFFNVLNGATGAASFEPPTQQSLEGGVRVRMGVEGRSPEARLTPSRGAYQVEMEQLGRVELVVGGAYGYSRIGGDFAPLPPGSSLKGGVFYWQPADGFLGDYDLVFVRPDGENVPVRIHIAPKRYGGVRQAVE